MLKSEANRWCFSFLAVLNILWLMQPYTCFLQSRCVPEWLFLETTSTEELLDES